MEFNKTPRGKPGGVPFVGALVVPDTATFVGDRAYQDCPGITSLHLPDSITAIGKHAFENCEGITELHFPPACISIGSDAFKNCKGIPCVRLPEGLKVISPYAFSGCSGLQRVYIPSSVVTIFEGAFQGCAAATIVEFQSPSALKTIETFAFANIAVTSLHIPDTVTTIGSYAFLGCHSLAYLRLPNSLTTVGQQAFMRCHSIKELHLPESLRAVEPRAFSGLSSITHVRVPASLTNLPNGLFDDCTALATVILPDTLTYVGQGMAAMLVAGIDFGSSGAFARCTSLTRVLGPAALAHNTLASVDRVFAGCPVLGPERETRPDRDAIGRDAIAPTYANAMEAQIAALEAQVAALTAQVTGRPTPSGVLQESKREHTITPLNLIKPTRRDYWHLTMHEWCSARSKACVFAVFVCARRLDDTSAPPLPQQGADAAAAARATVTEVGATTTAQHIIQKYAHHTDPEIEHGTAADDDFPENGGLPALPYDAWLVILGFVPRHMLGRHWHSRGSVHA